MTEVEYGGGGTAHGWERSTDQFVCLEVPPAPVYKGLRGEASRPSMGAPGGGGVLLVGVGLPFPTPTRRGKGRGRGGRKEGGAAPPPSPIRFGLGGPRALPPLFHHLAHEAHYFFLVFP